MSHFYFPHFMNIKKQIFGNYTPLFFLAVSIFLVSCEENPGGVGSGIVTEDPIEIFAIDTLKVKASTVYVDTVNTGGQSRILAGSYKDPVLGEVTSNAYFQLLNPTLTTLSEDAEYDSLTLHGEVTYAYGNVDQIQTMTIHRVTEDIEPSDDHTLLYNSDHFEYESAPVGEISLIPSDKDEFEIGLSRDLGMQLFEKLQESDPDMSNQEEFEDYFKGLVILGDQEKHTTVTGFRSDTTGAIKMRLYYTDGVNETTEEQYVDFNIQTAFSFSEISSQRPEPLNELDESKEELASSVTAHNGYVQGGIGLMTRIELPTIDGIYDIAPNHVINGAHLYLFPEAGTYNDETPLPSSLVMYVGDDNNNLLGILPDLEGNTQYATPLVDDEFNVETYYKFNVLPFVEDELQTDRYTGRGLLLSLDPTAFNSSINRLVLGTNQTEEFDMYLQIVLTSIEFN